MKQKLAGLPNLVERSLNWFKEALEGVVSRVVRWIQGPPPCETRAGRNQLNLLDDDLKAVADQIDAYPSMGGKKGAANLAHNHAAWLGPDSYDTVKGTVAQLIGEELQDRCKGRPAPVPYEPPVATGLGQVWGGDIFEIKAWDVRIDVCDFLDVHNQEYVALEATLHTADSGFVAACFETACKAKGNKPPTVATKTDRGAQFKGLFSKALKGRTHHEQIPPGCPWFNGESERGHRDARALIHAELSKMDKPKKGGELAAVQKACATAKYLLNEVISKPSLDNVTPKEIADGDQDKVRAATAQHVEKHREARKHRVLEDRRSLADRLRGMLGLKDWTRQALIRFLRLKNRDYKFIEEG
jgi:transposase InsO family protein